MTGVGAWHKVVAEVTTVTTPALPAQPGPKPKAPVVAPHRDAVVWGRVDEHGVVYVRDGETEVVVGEFPDGTPDEALAYFTRKYADLAAAVGLLEQRAQRGAPPADVATAVSHLKASLATPNAVGDLEALRTRLAALDGQTAELTAKQREEHQAQVEVARAEREAIVTEIEALAARDASQVQWKATTEQVDALFTRWQDAQRSSARLPKSEANALWTRFRSARTSIETQRRSFFAQLDTAQKDVKEAKERLVARAEALQTGSDPDPIGVYRGLLEDWKLAGRAGRKADDALWARFKAAGDVLYAAKNAALHVQDEEFSDNLTAKLALLDEAEPIASERDARRARARLTEIQRRWDAIGKVPREQVRVVEDRLRHIEQAVKQTEQEHWRTTNPETKARSEGLAAQLESAIAKLDAELAAAKAAKNPKAIKDAEDALAARRIWLDALGR